MITSLSILTARAQRGACRGRVQYPAVVMVNPLPILSKDIVISEKCNAAASLDAR
jgi:hypothetical protein